MSRHEQSLIFEGRQINCCWLRFQDQVTNGEVEELHLRTVASRSKHKGIYLSHHNSPAEIH